MKYTIKTNFNEDIIEQELIQEQDNVRTKLHLWEREFDYEDRE